MSEVDVSIHIAMPLVTRKRETTITQAKQIIIINYNQYLTRSTAAAAVRTIVQ